MVVKVSLVMMNSIVVQALRHQMSEKLTKSMFYER
jgi:hypothetical protein